MSPVQNHQSVPDVEAVNLARTSATELGRLLSRRPAVERVRVQLEEAEIVLPRQALTLLHDLLAEMGQGNAVTIVPTHTKLTTQQAADLLNVSRPHVIKLLDEGTIPCTMTETHRRVRLPDLMDYKRRQDDRSKDALDALTEQAQTESMGY